MLLRDKVIIITGVGPGMGRKMALIAAAEGAKVALAARSESFIKDVAEEVEAAGGGVIALRTDVDDLADCERLASATVEKWGRIDGLVNSAYLHGAFATFETATIEEWQAVMSVTCFGALRMIKAVLPTMKEQRDGAIVNVSSMGSVQHYPGGAAYSTAKAGLEGATRQLAKELGPYNIRVNATRMGRMDGVPWQGAVERMSEATGQTPEEISAPLRSLIALGQFSARRGMREIDVVFHIGLLARHQRDVGRHQRRRVYGRIASRSLPRCPIFATDPRSPLYRIESLEKHDDRVQPL